MLALSTPASWTPPAVPRRVPAAVSVLLMAVLAAPSFGAAQDKATIDLGSSSAEARNHFWAGIDDMQNVFPGRAAVHFEQALAADPSFGLAQVLHGFVAPGLDGDARREAIAKGTASLSKATTDELLLAAAVREWQAGNNATASRIFHTLSELNPDDPRALTFSNQLANARGDQTDVATRLREVNERFPDFAPAYNNLAYTLWPRGDQAGAMEAVTTYMRLAPNHPNSHDSYAELLQWAGRYQEALAHYRRAAELDATYEAAYTGAAEVHHLMGNGEEARKQFQAVAERAATPGARVNYLRSVAATWWIAGDRGRTMSAFQAAAAAGEQGGANGAAAFAHLQMALADASLGNGREVDGHLAKAAELNGDDTPVFLGVSGLAYAKAGRAADAREAKRKLAEGASGPFWTSLGHQVEALALMSEKKMDAAVAELAKADPGDPTTKALMAKCLEELGRRAEAGALRSELAANRQINLANSQYVFAAAEIRRR